MTGILKSDFLNINREESVRVLNKFTLQGGVPEPLRIARLLARTLTQFQTQSNVVSLKPS